MRSSPLSTNSSGAIRTSFRRMGARCRAVASAARPARPKPCSSSGKSSRRRNRPRLDGRSVLSGIPRALPSLLRAHEIGSRVAAVGFDWDQTADVVDKIDEEVREPARRCAKVPRGRPKSWVTCCSRWRIWRASSTLSLESALREANDKFTRRFDQLEAWMAARGRSVHGTPLTELEEAWQAVKALPAKDATPARSGRTRTARIPSGRRSRSPRRRRDRS